jgi:chorismate-pyruvate lyase
MPATPNPPVRTATTGPGVDLVSAHFLDQGSLPPDLREVEPTALDPFLRLLLFSDGSVTRTLAVHDLKPVVVRLLEQTSSAAAEDATALAAEPGEPVVRRRIAIAPDVFAESNLVPARLPATFLPTLASSRGGIGEALDRCALEVRRELLWFGLCDVPAWAPPLAGEALLRCYRIVSGGQPAILIREGFGVRSASGRYAWFGASV